ncbi:hypothetical protein CR513_30393, partial [Mucuna pruriens]
MGDPSKIEVVLEWEAPKLVSKIRSFLGLSCMVSWSGEATNKSYFDTPHKGLRWPRASWPSRPQEHPGPVEVESIPAKAEFSGQNHSDKN